MKTDRVVALLTESGKTVKLPKLIVGLMESWVAMPGQPYGNNRAEMIRHALCWMKNGIDRHDREREWEATIAAAIAPDKTGTDPDIAAAIRETIVEVQEEGRAA